MRLVLVLALLLLPALAHAEDGPDAETLAWARKVVARQLENAPTAPAFPDDREWLNVARPLSLDADLRGKVVILDFWCYCCINCMHVLPDLEFLEKKYAGKPFAVVGVHSAKFDNEKNADNIREAIRRYEIHHPVVNDDDFRIWRGYGARSWPTFVLLAPDGRVLGRLSGEGHRDELDALTQATLEHFETNHADLLDAAPLPMRLERSSRPPGQLAYPGAVTADEARNCLYISDSNHNRIVQVGLDGRFQRAFGSGLRGLQDGGAADARFFRPQGTCLDGDVLWVADTENHAIRRIDLETGAVTTAAGTGAQGNLYALVARTDAGTRFPAATTALNSPWDLLRVGETLVITMAGSHQLWMLSPGSGALQHLAGTGAEQRLDAASLTAAAFAQPSGLTRRGAALLLADSESSSIVKVTLPDGPVETLAGASARPRDLFHFGDEDGQGRGRRFQHPLDVLWHDGVLYVADAYNDKIKVVDPETRQVTTRWGDGTEGATDAPPRFSEPGGLAALGTTLFVADTNNHAVRTVDLTSGTVATLPLQGVPIPRIHTRGRSSADAGTPIPGTETLPKRALRVSGAGRTQVTVEVTLPLGWKFSPEAPSGLTLVVAGTRTRARLGAGANTFEIPSLEVGTYVGRLRLLYYVCQEQGACRMRSVEIPLDVTVAKDAPVPVLRDTFVP